jgi:hypothetical protein
MLRLKYGAIVAIVASCCFAAVATEAQANVVKMTHKAGAYEVELNLLNAEPFGAPMSAMPGMSKGQTGMVMVVKGGADPVQMDAPSHPNHHLVVHIYDAASRKVVTDANVTITFTAVDGSGKPIGEATQVPVVIMEASDKGAASTHYGNNVTMPPGSYRVDVTVNGAKTAFRLKT